MCHPVLMGLVAGALLAKMAFRFRRYRHGGGGCGGGRWSGGRGHRRWGGANGWFRIISALRGLDLNDRQRDDAREVIGKIKDSIAEHRAHTLDNLIGAVGGESFDRARAEAAIAAEPRVPEGARKEILDGLEHLHNILTPEQRAHLRTTLAGEPTATSPQVDL